MEPLASNSGDTPTAVEAMTIAVSVLSIVASLIAVYVTLYVKSCIGPIIAKGEEHDRRLNEQSQCNDRRIEEEGKLWREIHSVSRRVALIEGGEERGRGTRRT